MDAFVSEVESDVRYLLNIIRYNSNSRLLCHNPSFPNQAVNFKFHQRFALRYVVFFTHGKEPFLENTNLSLSSRHYPPEMSLCNESYGNLLGTEVLHILTIKLRHCTSHKPVIQRLVRHREMTVVKNVFLNRLIGINIHNWLIEVKDGEVGHLHELGRVMSIRIKPPSVFCIRWQFFVNAANLLKFNILFTEEKRRIEHSFRRKRIRMSVEISHVIWSR